MSRLTVYAENSPGTPRLRTEAPEVIAATLKQVGVRFERWDFPGQLSPDDGADTILAAFRPHLDALMGECGAGTADVLKMRGVTEAYPAMRQKFIDEHTHTEDEIRFFVHGAGNFVLHLNGEVYDAHCTEGDLISVPAGTRHWFDAGETPFCTVLRVFTDTSGWTPHYTGEKISALFPVS
jgi:1,2-dihydroxy-3-keto-5-methylthiopentene dioxygenase